MKKARFTRGQRLVVVPYRKESRPPQTLEAASALLEEKTS